MLHRVFQVSMEYKSVKVIDHYKDDKVMSYLKSNVKNINEWNPSVDNTASSNLNMMVNDFMYRIHLEFQLWRTT